MSTGITFNGSSYTVPAIGDASWGTSVSNYLIAIASGCLQKTGGTFTLGADVDFGSSYGLKALYLKSETLNIAQSGYVQLGVTDTLSWRNNANTADLALSVDASDLLNFNGKALSDGSTPQTFTNKLFSDSTCKFVNVSDATKALMFSLGGAQAASTMTLSSSQTANRTITLPDATDTVALLTTAQTLTNKTHDNTNVYTTSVANSTFQDSSDASKQFKFVASSITTASTRLLTVPDTSDTLAVVNNAQTIKNKTFDNTNVFTPKVANFTLQDGTDATKQFNFVASGITTGNTRALTVPDGSGTLALVALQQTLTNKQLSDSTVSFANVGDATKLLAFSLGGATTSTQMTLASAQTAARTITFPDASDTLVGKATTDILTNKTATAMAVTSGSFINFLGQATARLNDASTNYVALKAPTSVTTYTVTLPAAAPLANQVLADAGGANGTLTWASVASSALTASGVEVGNPSNTRIATRTDLLGDISATTNSQTYTVTSASPGVFTVTGHGFLTGDKVYLTATQNGFTANQTYWVNKTGANTFTLCSSLANAVAGTGLTSSATTGGTVISGGFVLTSGVKGIINASSATAGYVGELISSSVTLITGAASGSYASLTSITLTPGEWDMCAFAGIQSGASTNFSQNSCTLAISTTSASGAGATQGYDLMYTPQASGVIGNTAPAASIAIPRKSVNITTPTTYYLNGYSSYSSSTPSWYLSISARRIR